MQKLFLLLLSIFTISAIQAQKVQLKKNMVLVDKKEQLEFVRTKKANLLKGELPHYSLKDLDGKELLVITDTIIFYAQLPNESELRQAYRTYLCTNPETGKSSVISKPNTLSIRKVYLKNLKELGFFSNYTIDHQLYQSFVEMQGLEAIEALNIHVDSTNSNRLKNFELTKNQFGALQERKPGIVSVYGGKIKDGALEIGQFKISKKGSYAHIFEIINSEGHTIATMSLFQKENNGNLKTLINGTFKKFHYKLDKEGKKPSNDEKFTTVAKYLVQQGFL